MREIDDAAEREDQRQAEGDQEKGRAGKEAVHDLLEDKDQLHVRLVQGWAGAKDLRTRRECALRISLSGSTAGSREQLEPSEKTVALCASIYPRI